MSYHIKSINLNEQEEVKESFKNYKVNDNDFLDNLSKINIFVGENNSGKSQFLRKLQSIEKYFFNPNNFNIEDRNNQIHKIKGFFQNSLDDPNYKFYFTINKEYIYSNIDTYCTNLKEDNTFFKKTNYINFERNIYFKYKLYNTNKSKINSFNFKKIYIPILRGLRNPIDKESKELIKNLNESDKSKFDNLYHQRTITDYKLNTEIFTGLSLYDDIKKLLLGTHEEREIIKDFENFLSEKFFNYERVTIIPKHDEDVLHISIGDEKDIPIYNLGDGIQSIIILTFPLFKNQGQKLLVFIEEPELFLHAGMQRILIETLLDSRFNDFQYFIATHSNHFLDITLDIEDNENKDLISIFTCQRYKSESETDKKFKVENVSSDSEITLKLLGVRNSSVFLSNCTIWVEGITDRLYLRHYLNLYQKELEKKNETLEKKDRKRIYREDIHFSFVEYSGGNITHWSFLDDGNDSQPKINVKKVCNKILLIVDNDSTENKNSTKKEERHRILSERLGDDFIRLECVEIENLINTNILFNVIKELEGLNSIDDLKTRKSLDKYTQNDYKKTRIGNFIDKKFLQENSTTRKSTKINAENNEKEYYKYADKSGTIKDKNSFCFSAIKYTKSYDDLSEEAQYLCEKMYSFIENHNK